MALGDHVPLWASHLTVPGNPTLVQGTLSINRDLLRLVGSFDIRGETEFRRERARARMNNENWDVLELMCSCPEHEGTRWLPDDAFARDAARPARRGRDAYCRKCRSRMDRARYRARVDANGAR